MLNCRSSRGSIIHRSLFLLCSSYMLIFLAHCKASNKSSRNSPSPAKKAEDRQNENNGENKENENQGKTGDTDNKPSESSSTCELNSWLSTENDPGGNWWSGPLSLEYRLSPQQPVPFSNGNSRKSRHRISNDTWLWLVA
ncbi:MAG: hypothetical protein AB8G05_11805 [Oligoflexales bacterium]